MTDKLDLENLAKYLQYNTWDLVRPPTNFFYSQKVERMLDCIWIRRYRLPSQKLTGQLWEANWFYEIYLFAESETVALRAFDIMQRFPSTVFIPGMVLLADSFSGTLAAWTSTGSIVGGELQLDYGEVCSQSFAGVNHFELTFKIPDVTKGQCAITLADGGTKFIEITSNGTVLSVETDLVALTPIGTIANNSINIIKVSAIGGNCNIYVNGICKARLTYGVASLTDFNIKCDGVAGGILLIDDVSISTMTTLTWVPSERVHELDISPPAPNPEDLKELMWKITFKYSYLEEIT